MKTLILLLILASTVRAELYLMHDTRRASEGMAWTSAVPDGVIILDESNKATQAWTSYTNRTGWKIPNTLPSFIDTADWTAGKDLGDLASEQGRRFPARKVVRQWLGAKPTERRIAKERARLYSSFATAGTYAIFIRNFTNATAFDLRVSDMRAEAEQEQGD